MTLIHQSQRFNAIYSFSQLNKVDLEDYIIAPLMLQWFLYLLKTVGKRAAVVSLWMRVSSLP